MQGFDEKRGMGAVVLVSLMAMTFAVDAQVEALKMNPEKVQYDDIDGVSGSFELSVDPLGQWSNGTGGGCLIADLSASIGTYPCSVASDCDAALAAYDALAPGGAPAGAWAYCAQAPGDMGGKQCWIRPGDRQDYCVISPFAPWPLDQRVTVPAASVGSGLPAFPLGGGDEVRWMLYTCLNLYDFEFAGGARDLPGCPNEDRNRSVVVTGSARTLKP